MTSDTPIFKGDCYEGLLELNPLVEVKHGEMSTFPNIGGIVRFQTLVSKSGKLNAVMVREVKDLLSRLEEMKLKSNLERVLEATK